MTRRTRMLLTAAVLAGPLSGIVVRGDDAKPSEAEVLRQSCRLGLDPAFPESRDYSSTWSRKLGQDPAYVARSPGDEVVS